MINLKNSLLSLMIFFSLSIPSGCGLLGGSLSQDVPVDEIQEDEDKNEDEPSPDPDEAGTLFLEPTEISGYAGELLRVHGMLNFATEGRENEDVTGDCEWRISPEEVATID